MHNSNQRTVSNDVKPNFWDSCVKLAQGFEEAAAVDPAGTESDDLSATPSARRAHLELEPDEGECEGESSRRRLGSSSTKFDALPLVWSPPGQRGN